MARRAITVEEHIRNIHDDNCLVKAFAVAPRYGDYTILWFDKEGYTITTCTFHPNGTSIGPALPLEEAKKEFLETVDQLLERR